MLNDDKYEILKQNFVDSQRLFSKLSLVADRVRALEYDESGMYHDEEELNNRHWLKLSSKIVNSLSESLDEFNIVLLENETLEVKELRFNLIHDEVISKINVDFSDENAISITQIS